MGGESEMTVKSTGALTGISGPKEGPVLEVVLKCDSAGSVEAVSESVSRMTIPEVGVAVISRGVGAVSKSDVLMAETAGRLIVGFQVGVVSGLEKVLREHRVEVRLYDVIYHLTDDLKVIAESFTSVAPEEEVTGSGKVVALFKSSRKGIIIGCEVISGYLAVGQHFRIISDMGPVYVGVVASLHIGDNAVQKATTGQKAGIRIKDFNRARVGDLVESYKPLPQRKPAIWQPTGRILRI
jgi:translation initiation factor IF-2